jgi:lysyl-tRNA synthetase class 2
MIEWKPTSTRSMLEHRCAVLTHARHFFLDRGVLEVDTPIVVNAPVTDVHIHSAKVQFADNPRPFFLHTSPEYAMKRLLAAGSGDIYQICHVVRGLERGRVHNAEFTLIEWYRTGYTLDQLMEEVETLVRTFFERRRVLANESAALVSGSFSARAGSGSVHCDNGRARPCGQRSWI